MDGSPRSSRSVCRLPLAALPGSKPGNYLIEELAITQVASAHQLFDLLEPIDRTQLKSAGLLTLGGVDYGPGETYPPCRAPGRRPNAAGYSSAVPSPRRQRTC